jgi:hypothetical protein
MGVIDRDGASGKKKTTTDRSYFDRAVIGVKGGERRPEAPSVKYRAAAIVWAGRTSALFGQRVGCAELGDVGDEAAGFGFGNEACFLGKKEDGFIHSRRDCPGGDDAGD